MPSPESAPILAAAGLCVSKGGCGPLLLTPGPPLRTDRRLPDDDPLLHSTAPRRNPGIAEDSGRGDTARGTSPSHPFTFMPMTSTPTPSARTRGPYHVEAYRDGIGWACYQIEGACETDEQMEANRRLFEAALKLLEALRLADQALAHADDCPYRVHGECICLKATLAAAIAEAT